MDKLNSTMMSGLSASDMVCHLDDRGFQFRLMRPNDRRVSHWKNLRETKLEKVDDQIRCNNLVLVPNRNVLLFIPF